MRLLIVILALNALVFAQEPIPDGRDPSKHDQCLPLFKEYSNPKGMQLQLDLPTTETDMSSFPSLEHTVTISGIVDSILPIIIDTALQKYDINACVEFEREGNTFCDYGLIGYVDSTSIRQEPVRRVLLRNFKVYNENESPMTKVLDSSWIYYPKKFELKNGDSIFIKNYSVLFRNIWEKNSCDYHPLATVVGEYFVNPTEDLMATTHSHVLKVEEPKIHNRDAGGRRLNDKKRHVIKY